MFSKTAITCILLGMELFGFCGSMPPPFQVQNQAEKASAENYQNQ